MTLSAQKYANTFRTVSGLINTVFDSDVILLCDTSLGAVNIDLAEIPANFWNTVYKLYVVDKSNNAGVNNITIKAPLGYTVNNASTFVVNVNGGSAIVRIISNTSYVAETNYGFGSGLAVQNEGVPITPSATTMNFVGAGVNATAVGGFVTVNIAGTAVVPLTSAQLLTLISTNAVVPNTWYLVSNAIFTLTLSDTAPILVQGVTTNSVSLSGSGIFLNADYQLVGNYSGVFGFVSNLGVWQSTLITVIGSVVIWNNLQYVNTTGVNGISNPSLDAVNWTVLAKNSTNGYIQAVDDITYQASSNNILSRSDVRNNFVENNRISYATVTEAFYQFQWGNNQVQSNSVSSDSVFICLNNYVIGSPAIAILPAIFGNQVSERSQCNLQINTRVFQNNSIKQSVDLRIISNSGIIAKNDFSQNGTFILENGIGSNFGDNTICKLFQCDIHNLSNNANFVANHIESSEVNIVTNTEDFSLNRILNSTVNINVSNNNITDNVFETANFDVLTINTGSIIGNRVTTRGGLSVNQNDGQIVNNVISGNSSLSIININQNEVIGNIVRGFSLLNITTNNGFINNNEFTTQTTVSIVTNGGIIKLNIASNNCIFSVEENTSNGDISENIISTSTFEVQVVNRYLINNNVVRQNSNFIVGTNASQGEIRGNSISEESTFILNTNDGWVGIGGRFNGNVVQGHSTLNLNNVDNAVPVGSLNLSTEARVNIQNVFNSFGICEIIASILEISNMNNSIEFIQTFGAVYSITDHNQTFMRGQFAYGISNIMQEIDMADLAVYNPATFTLTLNNSSTTFMCGYLTLINGGGQTIEKIVNTNGNAPTTFFSGGGIITFVTVAVGGALANEIVSTTGAGAFAINFANNDSLVIAGKNTSVRFIDQVNIYL